jgi:hypothetical protein
MHLAQQFLQHYLAHDWFRNTRRTRSYKKQKTCFLIGFGYSF